MAAEYVELTNAGGSKIYVNLAQATVVAPQHDGSRIYFVGDEDYVDVRQTPAQVMEAWFNARRT